MNDHPNDPDSTVDAIAAGHRAHPARVYNYLLGDKDHFAVDREAAEAMIAALPELPLMARANRAFLRRAVEHLVADLGVTQFLDIGSGIPTMRNVHEVAQDLDPTARVVYVDKDAVVAAYSRALLTSTPQGRTAFIQADATAPAALLARPELAETLDLTRPVALMLVSVLMYFDDATATDIVSTLVGALPPGSHLVLSHPTADFTDPHAVEQARKAGQAAGLTYIPRTRARIEALFDGLELCGPGVVPMTRWRPAISRGPNTGLDVHYYVGVGRKP
ncbi:SAM-dependent methyltransferase [Pseudonocardia lacus]|uniref:SAM-dependent methyltransferase n=1 Tax=Pseudonocardia lacus TaxID=2835865 RepID=UPI001BDBC874|nr:SAM-dependent methyltransferase [Pseudonocardia lacus]